MSAGSKNYTFTLPVEVVEKLCLYVQHEYIPSLNAGVCEALEAYTVKLAKDQLRREMEAAAEDKAFLADIDEAMQAFTHSDIEVAVKPEE